VIGKRSMMLGATVALLAPTAVGAASLGARDSLPRCSPSQLRLELGPSISEKTEQHTAAFVITSQASSECTLEGYPGVVLRGARGESLPFTYLHRGDQMITEAKPRPVPLRPGASAYFELNKNACVGRSNRIARTIEVLLSGPAGAKLSSKLARYPILDYCRPPDAGQRITVSPIEPSLAAAACTAQGSCDRSIRGRAAPALPAAGSIVVTTLVPVRDGMLFAARAKTLFVITFPQRTNPPMTIERVDSNGTLLRSKRISFPLTAFLSDLSAGPDGLYAGTAVIKRFRNVPDVLLRIDPTTLAVRARASFPSRVATLESRDRMWATIGDGRVLRLDPLSLHVIAARRLLSALSVATQGLGISKPAFGFGSVWVIAGDRSHAELVRLDPSTLAVRSRTNLPRGVPIAGLLAGRSHLYLVGNGFAPVDAGGRVVGRTHDPNLSAFAIDDGGLVALDDAPPAIELLTTAGRVTARTLLRDSSAELVVSGSDAWLLGDSGRGNGIVRVRLRRP
jgi:hypothetical protein